MYPAFEPTAPWRARPRLLHVVPHHHDRILGRQRRHEPGCGSRIGEDGRLPADEGERIAERGGDGPATGDDDLCDGAERCGEPIVGEVHADVARLRRRCRCEDVAIPFCRECCGLTIGEGLPRLDREGTPRKDTERSPSCTFCDTRDQGFHGPDRHLHEPAVVAPRRGSASTSA